MAIKCLTLSSFRIILGLAIVSAARDIVAIGVLNSCVILLIKSDFISDIFFCLIMKNMLRAKVKRIISENNEEAASIYDIFPRTNLS